MKIKEKYTLSGIKTKINIENIPERVYYNNMNKIGEYIKQQRKEAGLTQEEFAIRAGLGLRFVRELEQGKETVRLDKVNQALSMFGMEAVPGRRTN
jgi:y4mF family transcriptional regulator